MTYRCPKCRCRKPRKSFGDNKSRPDGRATYCKTCKARAARKARAQRRSDLEAVARVLGRKGIGMTGRFYRRALAGRSPLIRSFVPHGNSTTTNRGRKS